MVFSSPPTEHVPENLVPGSPPISSLTLGSGSRHLPPVLRRPVPAPPRVHPGSALACTSAAARIAPVLSGACSPQADRVDSEVRIATKIVVVAFVQVAIACSGLLPIAVSHALAKRHKTLVWRYESCISG